MELDTRLSTLPINKQLEAVQRIFQNLAMAYGKRQADLWQGQDMQDVWKDWADALQGCSLGAIKHGIDLAKLDTGNNPPTQGQFLALCKTYKPAVNKLQLVHRLTPEQIEENKRRIAEITNNLAKKQRA